MRLAVGISGLLILAIVMVSGCTDSGAGREVNLTGKNYEALVNLGIPIKCQVSRVGMT